MTDVKEIHIAPKAAKELAQAFNPFCEIGSFARLSKAVGGHPADHSAFISGSAVAEYLMKETLGPEFCASVQRFGEGEGSVLVLRGLEERKDFEALINASEPHMPISEMVYLGIARMLGARISHDLWLDYVRDGFDDNIHQDGMYTMRRHSKPADFVALRCLNPGTGDPVQTLFFDLNAIMACLPAEMVAQLAKALFVPKNGTEFLPIVENERRGWRLNPAFAICNPFSSGLLSTDGIYVKNMEAKIVLDNLALSKPLPHKGCVVVNWAPGMMVIANQRRIFHRRHAAPNVRNADRLLARARILTTYKDCDVKSQFPYAGWDVCGEDDVQHTLDWVSGYFNAPEMKTHLSWLLDWSHDQHSHLPQFQRGKKPEHIVVDSPPTRQELNRRARERFLAIAD